MQRNNEGSLALTLTVLVGVIMLLSISTFVYSVNNDNSTVTAQVNITNTEPKVSNVNFDDNITAGNFLTLIEGTTKVVWCNGTIWDYNGVPGDINNVWAVIYDMNSSDSSAADDENYHYTNNSCANITQINATAAIYSCTFNVWYYANNATWTCNMTVNDSKNIWNTSLDSSPPYLQELFAINLTPVIDFGSLGVLETSNDTMSNITNTGNMNINITVEAWKNNTVGYSPLDNISLTCDLGQISGYYMRYSSIPDTAWASMASVNNTATKINGINLPQRTTTEIVNITYWKLQVPLGVGGWCNGTVVYTATLD